MTDPSKQLLARLRRLVGADFGASQRDRRFLSIQSTALIPALFGIWCSFLPALWGWSGWLAGMGTIGLVAYQAALVLRTLDRPQALGPMLLELAGAEEALLSERAASGAALDEANRLASLQSWALSLYPLEAAAFSQEPDALRYQPASQFFEPFLSPLCRDPQTMFGFTHEDVWNFAVYLYGRNEDALRPMWRRTDPRHPSCAPRNGPTAPIGRSWKPGVGHVGVAFGRNAALITPDATQEGVREIFAAAGAARRPYDETHYRSFASIPFGGSELDGRPIGVLVGTSSRAGAFDDRSALPLRHAATVFTSLSSVILDLPS